MHQQLKIRQVYHPTAATHQLYRAAINNDLGIYHVQSGAGIGGFFKSLLKRIIPVGKSLLKKGFEAAKPALHDLALKGIDEGTKYAAKQVEKKLKPNAKRKKDELS